MGSASDSITSSLSVKEMWVWIPSRLRTSQNPRIPSQQEVLQLLICCLQKGHPSVCYFCVERNGLSVTLDTQLRCFWILVVVIRDLWDQGPADFQVWLQRCPAHWHAVNLNSAQLGLAMQISSSVYLQLHKSPMLHTETQLHSIFSHNAYSHFLFGFFLYSKIKLFFTSELFASFPCKPSYPECAVYSSKLYAFHHLFIFLVLAVGTWTLSPSQSVEIVFWSLVITDLISSLSIVTLIRPTVPKGYVIL